jgi:TPR repeat protein
MKANRLIFTLLLASSVAVVQLAAQQTTADQKPIEEVKAKAEAGDAKSQVELGFRYKQGKGVEKDQAEAVKWYRKAAEQNFAEAQFSLGVCYYEGEGVAKDQAEAVKWHRKAAEQNLAKAQYNLGVCYAHGEGVAKDQVDGLTAMSPTPDESGSGLPRLFPVAESQLRGALFSIVVSNLPSGLNGSNLQA